MSSLFRIICFPFEYRIVTVEQKSFNNSGMKASSGDTIPVIDNSQPTTENVGVGMYLFFMGTFNNSTPILTIGSNLGSESSLLSSIPFCILHLEDPWTIPSPSTLDEDPRPTNMDMLLSTMMIYYQSILVHVVDPSPSSLWTEEENPFALPT